MTNEYIFLVEKEEIWARMLMQVLEDNDIPCAAVPVFGAAFALKTGTPERVKVFVPSENLLYATELLQELFSGEIVSDEDI